jgi:hypothetical protein
MATRDPDLKDLPFSKGGRQVYSPRQRQSLNDIAGNFANDARQAVPTPSSVPVGVSSDKFLMDMHALKPSTAFPNMPGVLAYPGDVATTPFRALAAGANQFPEAMKGAAAEVSPYAPNFSKKLDNAAEYYFGAAHAQPQTAIDTTIPNAPTRVVPEQYDQHNLAPMEDTSGTVAAFDIGAMPTFNAKQYKGLDWRANAKAAADMAGDVTPAEEARIKEREARLAEAEGKQGNNALINFGLGMLGKQDFYRAMGESGTRAFGQYNDDKKSNRAERDTISDKRAALAIQAQNQRMQNMQMGLGMTAREDQIGMHNVDAENSAAQFNASQATERLKINATMQAALKTAAATGDKELMDVMNKAADEATSSGAKNIDEWKMSYYNALALRLPPDQLAGVVRMLDASQQARVPDALGPRRIFNDNAPVPAKTPPFVMPTGN